MPPGSSVLSDEGTKFLEILDTCGAFRYDGGWANDATFAKPVVTRFFSLEIDDRTAVTSSKDEKEEPGNDLTIVPIFTAKSSALGLLRKLLAAFLEAERSETRKRGAPTTANLGQDTVPATLCRLILTHLADQILSPATLKMHVSGGYRFAAPRTPSGPVEFRLDNPGEDMLYRQIAMAFDLQSAFFDEFYKAGWFYPLNYYKELCQQGRALPLEEFISRALRVLESEYRPPHVQFNPERWPYSTHHWCGCLVNRRLRAAQFPPDVNMGTPPRNRQTAQGEWEVALDARTTTALFVYQEKMLQIWNKFKNLGPRNDELGVQDQKLVLAQVWKFSEYLELCNPALLPCFDGRELLPYSHEGVLTYLCRLPRCCRRQAFTSRGGGGGSVASSARLRRFLARLLEGDAMVHTIYGTTPNGPWGKLEVLPGKELGLHDYQEKERCQIVMKFYSHVLSLQPMHMWLSEHPGLQLAFSTMHQLKQSMTAQGSRRTPSNSWSLHAPGLAATVNLYRMMQHCIAVDKSVFHSLFLRQEKKAAVAVGAGGVTPAGGAISPISLLCYDVFVVVMSFLYGDVSLPRDFIRNYKHL